MAIAFPLIIIYFAVSWGLLFMASASYEANNKYADKCMCNYIVSLIILIIWIIMMIGFIS